MIIPLGDQEGLAVPPRPAERTIEQGAPTGTVGVDPAQATGTVGVDPAQAAETGDGPAQAPAGREAGAAPPGGPGLRGVLQSVGAVVAPTTLVTALAFYFGFVRTDSLFGYFGIDGSLLGFSSQDYVLRSADALFLPLAAAFVAGLVVVRAHSAVSRWLARRHHLDALRWAAGVATGLGLVLFGSGAWAVFRPLPFDLGYLFPPLSLGLGALLLAYATYVGRRLRTLDRGEEERHTEPRWVTSTNTALVGLLVVISLFWAASEYARDLGEGRAEDVAADLSVRPGVVLYSKQSLQITAPGVRETRVEDADATYRYRYEGLRFLIRSGGKHFMVPEQWTRSSGAAIVLPDTDHIRLEFTGGSP